jgi:hypothetical protein
LTGSRIITCASACFVAALLIWMPAISRSGITSPPTILKAMSSLRGKTDASLWAPKSLLPLPLNDSGLKYYVADVEHSKAAYKIELYRCPEPTLIGKTGLECGSLSNMFGGFGAYVYPSPDIANRAFQKLVSEDCYNWVSDYTPREIQVAKGVTGWVWGTRVPVVRWRYHGWSLAICWEGDNTSSSGAIAAAKDLMNRIDRYPLPAPTGYMVESLGADNMNTRAVWLDDHTVVNTWGIVPDYGVPLASEMRKWPATP